MQKIGPYEIAGLLATGGMAEILLGRRVGPSEFERVVVIKRILSTLAKDASYVSMFVDEARIAARIHHPNVVQVFDLVIEDELLCIVMEYLEGETLASLFRRAAARDLELPREICAHVVAEAAAGLHAAHELVDEANEPVGLVHRDVSPQNVFVNYDGSIKLLDFGVAKARGRVTQTQIGQLKGSYAYMSPEQCRADPLDRRSDLFSLGVILYEITTGRRLFARSNHLLTLKAVVDDPIAPPSATAPGYPPRLEAVVLRALERDRDRRYQTASELRHDLLAAAADLGPPGVAEGRLSELMRDLFADRIAEKEALLSSLRTGERVVDKLPAPETDLATVIPSVAFRLADLEAPPTEPFQLAAPEAAPAEPAAARLRPRRARWPIALLLLAALAASAALAAVTLRGASSTAPAATRPSRVAPAVPSDAGGGGAEAAPPGSVVLHVDSIPPGAEIWIDDVLNGSSPADVEVPRSTKRVELTLLRDGYVPVQMSLVPEVAQRLEIRLVEDTSPADAGVDDEAWEVDADGADENDRAARRRWRRRWQRLHRVPGEAPGETSTKYRRFD